MAVKTTQSQVYALAIAAGLGLVSVRLSCAEPDPIRPVPISFAFGNVDGQGNPNPADTSEKDTAIRYARVDLVLEVTSAQTGKTTTIKGRVAFGAAPGPNNGFFVKTALVNRTILLQTIFWDGRIKDPATNKVTIPAPGDRADASLEFFTNAGQNQVKASTNKVAISFEYDIKVKVNGKEDPQTVSVGAKTELTSGLGLLEKAGNLYSDSGFYIVKVGGTDIIFVSGKKSPGNVMKADWRPPAEGEYSVTAFARVDSLAVAGKEHLSTAMGVLSTNAVIVKVIGGNLTITISVVDKDYYGTGRKVRVGVDNRPRAGPDNLRQFPEIATFLVEVKMGGKDGPLETSYNGEVEVREDGNLLNGSLAAPSDNLSGGLMLTLTGGQREFQVQWVAAATQQDRNSHLVARFPGEARWRENPNPFLKQAELKSIWSDFIGRGGGNKLAGVITDGGNGVSDWLDVMMGQGRSDIAATGSDAMKIVNEIKEYIRHKSDHGIMASKGEVVEVDETNPLLRPTSNFEPRFEGRIFTKTKTPYGNALTHELRHAYITRLTRGNDADGDKLPDSLGPANDITQQISFPFGPNQALTTVQDPNTGAKEPAGTPSKTQNEPFARTAGWTPKQDDKDTTFEAVYQVQDPNKLEIEMKEKFVFRLNVNGQTLDFPREKATLTKIKVLNTEGAFTLTNIQPVLGQLKFTFIAPKVLQDSLENLNATLNAGTVNGDYSYSDKNDGQSRLELDAYTFAQMWAPEDR